MNEYEVEVDRHTTHATHHRTRSLQASLQSPAGWRRPCEVPATACNRHPQGQYARREARTRYQGNGAFRESGGGRNGAPLSLSAFYTRPFQSLHWVSVLWTRIFGSAHVFSAPYCFCLGLFWQMCRIDGAREIDALTFMDCLCRPQCNS